MNLRLVLLHMGCVAGTGLVSLVGPAQAGTMTALTGEKAYPLAGEALADLWEDVTGQRPVVRIWDGAASPDQETREGLPEGWSMMTRFRGKACP